MFHADLQDKDRNVLLALRYGWLARDFVDLSLLQHPPVQPKYPRQMYWQKDLCADGERHVTGAPHNLAWISPASEQPPRTESGSRGIALVVVTEALLREKGLRRACLGGTPVKGSNERLPCCAVERPGSYKDHIPWTSVAGLCTVTPRAQCTEEVGNAHSSDSTLQRAVLIGAVWGRTVTAHVHLEVVLMVSSGAFNVTTPGMSVVCYEIQISGSVQSTTSSSCASQQAAGRRS